MKGAMYARAVMSGKAPDAVFEERCGMLREALVELGEVEEGEE